MEKVFAQVSAPFDPGGEGSISLSIEGDPGFYSDTNIHLLLLPGVNAHLVVTTGELIKGATVPFPVNEGVLSFSGSDRTSLPKEPVFSIPTFNSLFAFDAKGNSISISCSYDPDSRTVKASRPCYAAVKYSKYLSSAKKLTYIPFTEELGSSGVRVVFGVIAAYYPPTSIITYQVEPTNTDNGTAETELYRIVSSVVTTGDGEFEKPPGYPGSGTYPGKALVLDVETSLMTQRVHEIGFMDANGRGYVREYFNNVLEPYIGDTGYVPAKTPQISTLSKDKYSKEMISRAKNFIKSRGFGAGVV